MEENTFPATIEKSDKDETLGKKLNNVKIRMNKKNLRKVQEIKITLKKMEHNMHRDIEHIRITQKRGIIVRRGSVKLDNGHLLIYSVVDNKTRAKTGVGCMIQEDTREKVRNQKYYNKKILFCDF